MLLRYIHFANRIIWENSGMYRSTIDADFFKAIVSRENNPQEGLFASAARDIIFFSDISFGFSSFYVLPT
jgi:hypothetical protein